MGTRYELSPGEPVSPGVRVMNSLEGSWAVRAEGTGVRIACANQLYSGRDKFVELREVHLSSATDLLAMLPRAIHTIPSRFKDALRVYEVTMGEEMLVEQVGPVLLAADLLRVHAGAIGARAEAAASHNALLTRWAAYQVATAVLTHEVALCVSPERSRKFEQAAASVRLLPVEARASA